MVVEKPIRLLVIEDEAFDVSRIKNTLKAYGNELVIKDVVSNGRAAIELLEKSPNDYDVVITDYQISGGIMGEKLIEKIKVISPTIEVIVVTKMTINHTNINFATNLINAGAFWYCTKYPGDIEDYIYQPTDFVLSIYNAYQKKLLQEDTLRSKQKLTNKIESILADKPIIGISSAAEVLKQNIEQCSQNNVNVVITGPSGTGKELVATHIHYKSERRLENFVAINCGSIPSELIESELFGFEKGSFTGAVGSKPGLFELANNGTVFLDEISDLPLSAQVKLLRVLQDGEIEKIGRSKKLKVNVRIIAASNKNLTELVQYGEFREDLYYRLNVIQIHVPAIHNRKEDIPLLIHHYLEKNCREMGRDKPVITDNAMNLLIHHQWPGNVRELMNVVQRMLFQNKSIINEDVIRQSIIQFGNGHSTIHQAQPIHSKEYMEWKDIIPWRDMEKEIKKQYFSFVRTASESDAEAAKKLGMAPPNFYRMCKELGLK